MRKQYISPQFEIDKFDICGIILASGDVPQAETLIKEGTPVGDKKMKDLMN